MLKSLLLILLLILSPMLCFGGGYVEFARPNTELSKAVYYGHNDQARQLIEAGTDLNEQNRVSPGYEDFTALMWAVIGNNEEIIKCLVESGADINATAEQETTALHLSIISEITPGDCVIVIPRRELNASTVKLLLSFGADVSAYNEYGTTFMYAIWIGHTPIAQLLIAE